MQKKNFHGIALSDTQKQQKYDFLLSARHAKKRKLGGQAQQGLWEIFIAAKRFVCMFLN